MADPPPTQRPVWTWALRPPRASLSLLVYKVVVLLPVARCLRYRPGWTWSMLPFVWGPDSSTRIFRKGSVCARRPAITQAVAPPCISESDAIQVFDVWLETYIPPAKIMSYSFREGTASDMIVKCWKQYCNTLRKAVGLIYKIEGQNAHAYER